MVGCWGVRTQVVLSQGRAAERLQSDPEIVVIFPSWFVVHYDLKRFNFFQGEFSGFSDELNSQPFFFKLTGDF